MYFKILIDFLILMPLFFSGQGSSFLQEEQIFRKELLLMGSRFEIVVVGNNAEIANSKIQLGIQEIKRIEALISSWRKESQTSLINENAGIRPVKVDSELFDLIKRAQKVSQLTQGAFDLTFGSLDEKLWHFDMDMTSLPDSAIAHEMVKLIDYKNLVLDENEKSVFLKYKGMKIGFGAIGKGYAAEKVKALLLKNGVKSGIVNAGGDLTAWGNQPNGKPWTIGIANPNFKNQAFSWLNISNKAVVTSGNYEKFVVIDGKRYTHLINPKTGFPVSGLKSVTIITTNAELADALATAVFIMGKSSGLALINQLNGIDCIIIDDNDELHYSKGIVLNRN
ncbi:FAD:protein FMN transferase [Flexithrix dorotheae]|uniref:FAD:protein FMN transferase n=1 Tax=Flexithrix dorotheae TaxID=70993 RepID=UPI00037320DC|nr:FAD:protein FMN transferase [Flexithrix dorotheae]